MSLGKGVAVTCILRATLRGLYCPLVVGSSIGNVNLKRSGRIKNKGFSSHKDDDGRSVLGNDDFPNNLDEGQSNFCPVGDG